MVEAPAPSLFDTGLSAEQKQLMEDANHRLEAARAGAQEAYDRRQAEIAAAPKPTAEQLEQIQKLTEVQSKAGASYNNSQNHHRPPVHSIQRQFRQQHGTSVSPTVLADFFARG